MSCRSSTRTGCTRSTAAGAPSWTSTPTRWGPQGLPRKGGGGRRAGGSPAARGGRRRGPGRWTPTVERTANYVRPDEMHQAFNFQYLATAWDAAELRQVIDRSEERRVGEQ